MKSAIFKEFNTIGEVIAYSSLISTHRETMVAAEEALRGIHDRNQRAQAKANFERTKNQKQLAKEMGLSQDEQLLKNLLFFTDLFYPDGFDITVFCAGKTVGYRGVIDKRWLRVTPELMRVQYGGKSIGPWVLVGQVTHVPGTTPDLKAPSVESTAVEATTVESDPEPSMRDPYMAMFEAALGFERAFLESKSRTEVVVTPLTIYREVVLQLPEP